MAELSFDELIMRIVKASGLNHEQVMARINAKVEELSGLVSMRGAAHIIASQYGIQVHESRKGKVIPINELIDGLNNISVRGIVTRVSQINEFESNGRKGRVASVTINDGTGEARIVFWNDTVKIIEDNTINNGDFIKVHHLRSKKGRYGVELHFNIRSRIELNPDEEKPIVKVVNKPSPSVERYLICDLQEGLNVELRATIVQIYDKNLFYNVCPVCGKSVKESCSEHNEKPVKALLVKAVLDDGSGTIVGVFFKELAESLLGVSTEQAIKIVNEGRSNDLLSVLGDEFIISGRINKNSFTDSLELIANSVVRVNPVIEAKRINKNS